MLSNFGRLLRVPWTARRLNQSILKKISPEYSLEKLMLKLKLQLPWPLDAKNWLLGKDSDAGKDWRQEEKEDRGWDSWMVSPTLWTWVWASSGIWWWTGKLGVLQSMGSQRVRYDWATELNWIFSYLSNMCRIFTNVALSFLIKVIFIFFFNFILNFT